MALIDLEVVRDGKWVSTSDTEPIEGELAIETSDDYGYYNYKLVHIIRKELNIVIPDAGDEERKHNKMVNFNKALKDLGLPNYFDVKEVQ